MTLPSVTSPSSFQFLLSYDVLTGNVLFVERTGGSDCEKTSKFCTAVDLDKKDYKNPLKNFRISD